MGARVVNASLSGPGASLTLEAAIAAHPGVLFVVAAGNDGVDVDAQPHFPCAAPQPNVVCVAATDQDDELASFSNRGAAVGRPGRAGHQHPQLDALARPAPGRRLRGRRRRVGRWRAAGRSPRRAASAGTRSLSDSPAGPYANGASSVARIADPVDLSGGSACRMRFDVRLALADDG